jgi:glutathione S-transferase
MLKVFGNPKSTCTRKVLMTLLEKEQPYEFESLDFRKGEHKSAEHLARQPFGVVPVLQDDNFSIYESRAIIRYIDHRFDGKKLSPNTAQDFGRMEQWISIEQSYFSAPALQIIKQRYFAPIWGQPSDENIVNEALPKIEKALDVAEKALSAQPYLAGAMFSLAEISWMPYIEYLFPSDMAHLINDRPYLLKWWQKISQRPTWLEVKTFNQS